MTKVCLESAPKLSFDTEKDRLKGLVRDGKTIQVV